MLLKKQVLQNSAKAFGRDPEKKKDKGSGATSEGLGSHPRASAFRDEAENTSDVLGYGPVGRTPWVFRLGTVGVGVSGV